jgi:hypothetical protein
MGGVGSGGWRIRTRWRATLEDLPSFHVGRWLRDGVLVPGTLFTQHFTNLANQNAGVVVAVLSRRLVSVFPNASALEVVRTDVELRWTNCRFGGQRPWFACPRCGRQCGRLYLLEQWKCRHCCSLPFRSQTLTPAERLFLRAAKLRRRLDTNTIGPSSQPPIRMPRYTTLSLERQIACLERQGRLMSLQAFFGRPKATTIRHR